MHGCQNWIGVVCNTRNGGNVQEIQRVRVPERLKGVDRYLAECEHVVTLSHVSTVLFIILSGMPWVLFGTHWLSLSGPIVCPAIWLYLHWSMGEIFRVAGSIRSKSRWRLARAAVRTSEMLNEHIDGWNAYLAVSGDGRFVRRDAYSNLFSQDLSDLRDRVQQIVIDADHLIAYASVSARKDDKRRGPSLTEALSGIMSTIVTSQATDQEKIAGAYAAMIEELEGMWNHVKLAGVETKTPESAA